MAGQTHWSSGENEWIISHDTARQKEEAVEIGKEQPPRASTSLGNPEGNCFEGAGSIKGNRDVGL